MKAKDITPCVGCGRGVMADHSLVFYRVKVEPLVVNLDNVRRVSGMQQLLGPAAALASVLGDDPDIAMAVPGGPAEGLLCLTCFASGYAFAQLVDAAQGREPG